MWVDWETLVKWQLRITRGEPKPEELGYRESQQYDDLAARIEAAAQKGHSLGFPGGDPPRGTSYIIVAQSGDALLLAQPDTEDSLAVVYAPDFGLSPVRLAQSYLEFGFWEPYEGAQDALEGVVPDDCLDAKRAPCSIHSDTDTMARKLRQIALGSHKPEGLSLVDSITWDRLAEQVAEQKRDHLVVDIPPE